MPPKSKPAVPPRPKKKGVRSTKKTAPPPPPPLSPPPSRPSLTTHIRVLSLSSGNPSIHTLLIDDTARTCYLGFKDRPLVPIHSITRSFIDSLLIPKLHDMLSVQPMTSFLLDNTDQIFPGMVGQFFANLRFENTHSRNVIVSQVNKINIRLDWHLLNTIFGTTLVNPQDTLLYWDDSHMWPSTGEKFALPELRQMFHVPSREAKDFNPSNLDPADRVIYHIVVNFVNPVAGHFTSPGKVPLVYYYLFTHCTPIDWGFVVFNRLCDLITDHRRNLPHAQFLTPVFKHFKIPFTEAGISPHPFDMSTLTKKGIRLHQGVWITRQAYLSLTQPSPSSQPPLSTPSSSQPASSSLEASIQLLQRSVNTLLRHVQYLEHGVQMALPAALREEFQSDKILFGISSDESDPEVDASEHDESDSEGDLSESHSSDNDDSASNGSESVATAGDEPLIHHFKKSKTAP